MAVTEIREKTTIDQEHQMVQHAVHIVVIALLPPESGPHRRTESRAPFVKTDGGQGVRHTQAEEVAIEEDRDPHLRETIHREGTHVQGLRRGLFEDTRNHQFELDPRYPPVEILLPTVVAHAHLRHQSVIFLREVGQKIAEPIRQQDSPVPGSQMRTITVLARLHARLHDVKSKDPASLHQCLLVAPRPLYIPIA